MESNLAIAALGALAQETRLAIFRVLVEAGPAGLPVGTIVDTLGVPPATMSFHLKELANAGLVSARQDGRYIYYSANFGQVTDLLGFLTQNCCARSGDHCVPIAAQPGTAAARGREVTRSAACSPARRKERA